MLGFVLTTETQRGGVIVSVNFLKFSLYCLYLKLHMQQSFQEISATKLPMCFQEISATKLPMFNTK